MGAVSYKNLSFYLYIFLCSIDSTVWDPVRILAAIWAIVPQGEFLSPNLFFIYSPFAYSYKGWGDDCFVQLEAWLLFSWTEAEKISFMLFHPTPFSPFHPYEYKRNRLCSEKTFPFLYSSEKSVTQSVPSKHIVEYLRKRIDPAYV